MTESLLKSNDVIFHEMMSHPILFTHLHPKTAAIIGDTNNGILNETIKHNPLTDIHQVKQQDSDTIPITDPRVQQHSLNTWHNTMKVPTLDVIISATDSSQELLQHYFNTLHKDGVLIQASASLFDPQPLNTLVNQIKSIGFQDLHILSFPQPSYPSGWRTAIIALKYGAFKRLREKAIYNKSFKTHYYNFDIHRASLVLPEFMREVIA